MPRVPPRQLPPDVRFVGVPRRYRRSAAPGIEPGAGPVPVAPELVRIVFPPEYFPPPGSIEFELLNADEEVLAGQTDTPGALQLTLPETALGIIRWWGNETSNRTTTFWTIRVNGAPAAGYGRVQMSLGRIDAPTPTFIRLPRGAAVSVAIENSSGVGSIIAQTRLKGWYWSP